MPEWRNRIQLGELFDVGKPVPPGDAASKARSGSDSTVSTEDCEITEETSETCRRSSSDFIAGGDARTSAQRWSFSLQRPSFSNVFADKWRCWVPLVLGGAVLVSFVATWCIYLKVQYGSVTAWWSGMPQAWKMQTVMCNTQLRVPAMDFGRKWRLDSVWMQTCEKRNKQHFPWQYPHDRNWCWIGLKAMCHAHLKAHHSWGAYQEMAANYGKTPPRATEGFNPLADPEVCDQPANGRSRNWTAMERGEAHAWFRAYVRVYVVNMPKDTLRWDMINKRLKHLRIEASRIFGVDMRVPNVMQTAKLEGWVPKAYNFSKAQELAYSKKHSMGSIMGTLGCASAHFKAQSQVLEDGSPLAVVLEDDSWPAEDFVERLWSLVHEELPCDWEVVSLMSRCPYGKCVSSHLSRVQPDTNEPAWRCHQGVNWGFQGVLYRTSELVWVQQKWKEVVFDEARPHCMDIDVALASISDQVAFYAVPAGQDPGFMAETNHPSNRWTINVAGRNHQLEQSLFDLDPNNLG